MEEFYFRLFTADALQKSILLIFSNKTSLKFNHENVPFFVAVIF